MKVPPKRTILIVIVIFFGTTGEDNPLKHLHLHGTAIQSLNDYQKQARCQKIAVKDMLSAIY